MKRWFRLRDVERDLDDEIALYFEEAVRDLVAGGMSPAAAREEASRRFGDTHQHRKTMMKIDRSADMRRRRALRLDGVCEVTKHAFRGVTRSPVLSLGIVLAFALGIGANATMYETVERLLLRPPPHIEDPESVRRLLVHRQMNGELRHTERISYPDYQDFARTGGFSHVAAHTAHDAVALGRGEAAEEVRVVLVTAGYWDLLGVEPALGRHFTVAEDAFGVDGVAVLSWSRWQSEYGGRTDVLGSTLDFDFGEYTIVGVAPKGFTGVDLQPVAAFLPFMTTAAETMRGTWWSDSRQAYWLEAIARIAPGSSVEAAQAEATTHHRLARGQSDDYVVAAPLLEAQGPNAPSEVAVARWLFGVAGVVLLIACLNVANLLLARMLRQRRETSIRLALGISRGRLIGQVVAESMLLGLAGGAAALLIALWGGTIVQTTLLPDVDWSGGPSLTLLLVVLGLSLLAGIFSGAVPALQASRRDVTAGLRTASGGISRSTARVRATLSMVQAALSVLLLIGAGLFVRSLNSIHNSDFGLDLWRVAYVAPVMDQAPASDEEAWTYYETATERVRRLPGVEAASVVVGVPFWSMFSVDVRAQGVDSIPHDARGEPTYNSVDAEYFRTVGLEPVRGRLFDDRDTGSGEPVVIVSESFVRALWPREDGVGNCLFIGGDAAPCSRVIGVVEDARRDGLIQDGPSFQYYLPLQQRQIPGIPQGMLVRTVEGDAGEAALAAIQRELLGADTRVRWVRAEMLEDMVAGELRQWRLGAMLFSVFGALALIVAAIGLYSVLAFDVAQRVREIGLRNALGASRRSIISLVLTRAVGIAVVGVATGCLLALMLAPRLGHMLYGVSPRDPLTFTGVIIALMIVSVAASCAPAWRAANVDPNVALKAD